MQKEFLIELESGGDVTAVEGGARMIKLQQIASGFIVDEHGQTHQLMPPDDNPRLQALLTELDKDHVKTIVWCRFKEDIRTCAEALFWLGIKSVEYHGAVKPDRRQQAIEEFMNDPECRVFLGQPKAGGTGINLSKAEKIIWYSHVFDAIDRNQASERATKVGGHHVALVDLNALGTIDSYILSKLTDKKNTANSVVIDLKEYLIGL
jgi:SNF2 family DNA or RNA helicase